MRVERFRGLGVGDLWGSSGLGGFGEFGSGLAPPTELQPLLRLLSLKPLTRA